MKLFDKVKNLFTEEVEEEIRPIKRETREPVVRETTRVERPEKQVEIVKEEAKPEKEEKFVFFSDDDFKDLEKPKPVIKKPEIKEKEVLAYRGVSPQVKKEEERKKNFSPSPIISPVYGVLDKNYSKDEVVSKKITPARSYRSTSTMTVDDIRNKAFGTIEDEIKDALFRNDDIIEETYENNIDIFEELDNFDRYETSPLVRDSADIDGIFSELDNKKDEILDVLDNKKDEILDVLDTKKSVIIEKDDYLDSDIDESYIEDNNDYIENSNNDIDIEDETLELKRQLESQKRKLEEINDYMDEEVENNDIEEDYFEEEKKEENNEDLNEDELFNLIDSMYEKRNEE